jgi:mRNA interferase RelE/StbE
MTGPLPPQPYEIQILPAAQKELDALPKNIRRQVDRHITQLSQNPRPPHAKALKGKQFAGLYRVRSGDYRIIYQIKSDRLIVLIVKVGNRRDIYE